MTLAKTFNDRSDIYQRVTDKIIAQLEAGVRPWMKPWSADNLGGSSLPLRVNGEPYKGVNVLLLWSEAIDKGYTSPHWMTYKQAQDFGANVRKGEHGSLVVYADAITRTEHNETTGEDAEKRIPFLKQYTVFNAGQIDGLPDKFLIGENMPQLEQDPIVIPGADFFKNTGAQISHGGNRAYYGIASDHIQMPPVEAFTAPQHYSATLAHELTHWTRHPTRLIRDFGRKQWGDEGYAKEELVAEIGSAYLCATLGLTNEVLPDHASYVFNWLTVLKDDKHFIIKAASHAQKAVDFLHNLQPKVSP